MSVEDFQTALTEHLELPFDISRVTAIESNCGSTWIMLDNSSSYFITIALCENYDEKADLNEQRFS